jgi:hypothetical protein
VSFGSVFLEAASSAKHTRVKLAASPKSKPPCGSVVPDGGAAEARFPPKPIACATFSTD